MPFMPISLPDVNRLAEIRHKFGLSQVEMARLLGVHGQSISKWETGTNECPHGRLVWYALFERIQQVWPEKMPPMQHVGVWLDVDGTFGALYRLLGVIYGA